MPFLFEPAVPASLPIVDQDERFPLRRVYCVGRNYAAHAIEMGFDPDKEPPFFFQKNPDNVFVGRKWPYASGTADLHHEIEMVVALQGGGVDVPVDRALELVFGYGVGLDMTRRDLQGEAKKLGRPWEIGKAFERSAPCGPLTPASRVGHPTSGAIWLEVNGERRQEGDLNQLIWKVPETISYLSRSFELAPGDLIMSGTPAGVAAVERGDKLHGHVDGLEDLELEVV
ncbi:MAG: fumarylacetoacetate hydrolase family protein [Pseudomonadota bacterium]